MLRRIASEPFVHFIVLGALVFAAHRALVGTADGRVLDISATKQREFAKLFEQRQQRAPTDEEEQQLINRYVEDEALFREGLRLSLVHTDPMLRALMIARTRTLLQAEVGGKPPTSEQLRRYYEAHRASFAPAASASPHPFESVREQLTAEYRKDQTAQAFQAEVARLASQYRVHVARQP